MFNAKYCENLQKYKKNSMTEIFVKLLEDLQ